MQKNSESLAWMEKRHSVRCYDGKPLSEQNQQILKSGSIRSTMKVPSIFSWPSMNQKHFPD